LDNLHTMYFKALLSGNQGVFDIGTGEIFFREKGINYSNEVYQYGHHTEKLKDKFNYPIISKNRYSLDKYLFHLSIIQNYKQPKKKDINSKVLDYLRNNPDVNIIGLDRGERHLIYLTIVNQKGELLHQESLNKVINTRQTVDYKNLLQAKENERTQARKDWGTIENIKELKEGYLSQIVHKIATMMVEHNAIVVMEDLNSGFKNSRIKVERQVYQKLEKMLIDKLNYLVFKNKPENEPGGLLNALQLANKFESFKNLSLQSGFIFYIPAWNTSKIDPATGFVDFLKPKYETLDKAKDFLSKFSSIHYNSSNQYFEFVFDYKAFTTKADGTKTNWIVCTHGEERFYFNKQLNQGKGAPDKINITNAIIELLRNANISHISGDNLIEDILEQNSADFFKKLLKYLQITLALRYSNGLKDELEKDYILSPVANTEGIFFNSLKAPATMPQDADANGAYHIALKGLMLLKRNDGTLIKLNEKGLPDEKKKFGITNKEWLHFKQDLVK
jgi:CRISPR-associated protein Cpf1